MNYLRILAALLAILVHALELAYTLLPFHIFIRNVMAALAGLGLSCNLLFTMLGRALLLGGKEEPILESYSRRLIKAPIPCFAYYLFCFFYAEGTFVLSPESWENLLQSFLSSDSGQTSHLWLVYIILMFYIAAPLFRVMLRHMIEPMLEVLTAVIIILHFIYTYGLLVRIESVAPTFLASQDSIFLPGYYCTTQSAIKHCRLFVTTGLLSELAIATAIMASENLNSLVYDNTPPQVLFTCTVLLFFRKHEDSLFVRILTLSSAIGRYSFPILLVHWLVLHWVVDDVFDINGLSLGTAGDIPVFFLPTLIISLALVFLYDNTTVLCMDRVCEILSGALGRVKRRS